MKIRLIGPRNTLGVGVHFSNFADALRRVAGIGDWVEEINSTSQEDMLAAAGRSEPDDVNICFVSINLQPFFRGTNLQWIVFESTRVPEIVMSTMLTADLVWVPSTWGRDTLIANGLNADRCDVVTAGVDPELYHPYLTKNPDQITRFLSVGKFEERKSHMETVLAWASVFGKDPTVELVIKTDHFVNVEIKKQGLTEFLDRLGITNVRAVWDKITVEELTHLYRTADAFILPSKGEGWGLPIIEAAAHGLPIVTTMYSAQTEFLQCIESSVVPVEYDIGPITCPEFKHFYPTSDGNWGSWAVPRVNSVADALIYTKENLPNLTQQAQINAGIIRQRYSWSACVDRALTTLQHRGLLKI